MERKGREDITYRDKMGTCCSISRELKQICEKLSQLPADERFILSPPTPLLDQLEKILWRLPKSRPRIKMIGSTSIQGENVECMVEITQNYRCDHSRYMDIIQKWSPNRLLLVWYVRVEYYLGALTMWISDAPYDLIARTMRYQPITTHQYGCPQDIPIADITSQ